MGAIVNCIGIVIGGMIGLLSKNIINEKNNKVIMDMIGISIAFIGLTGALQSSIEINDGNVVFNGGLLVFVSLCIGAYIGTSLDLDTKFNNCGKWIENKLHLKGFALGFVNASLVFCVGAMAIIGSISDGVLHDPSVLYLKSLIDGIAAIMMSATMGVGVIFSSISILIYEGSITLISAYAASAFSNTAMLNNVFLVGYLIVMLIGTNFLNVTKVKVANLLPSLLVPLIYELIKVLF